MRKMLVALCGVMLLGWGDVQPVSAKPSDAEIQAAAVKFVQFLGTQIQDEADALALYDQADRNGNGEVTFAEFKKGLKPFNLGIKSSVLKQVFLAGEAQFGNGDKKLTLDEYLDFMAAVVL